MRKLSSEDIDKLSNFLAWLDDDSMLFSTLDGFLAGIVVCPELVTPGEWLPMIWGESGPGFEDVHQANDILGLIMARYNYVVHSLGRAGKYQPILDPDTDGTFLWENWAEGFGAAMELRPDAWEAYDDSKDPDVCSAFRCLCKLAIAAALGEDASGKIDQDAHRQAPSLIAECLEDLHGARLAMQASQAVHSVESYAGRNDPCPCGSGRKFKKCCLN